MHVSRLLNRPRTAAIASATALILGLSAPLALAADENSLQQQEETAQEAVDDTATDEPTQKATAESKAKKGEGEKKSDPTPPPTTESPENETAGEAAEEATEPDGSDAGSAGDSSGDSEESDESTPTDTEPAQKPSEEGAGVVVQSVPIPEDDEAVVTVRTGGVRTGASAVAPLPGVVLGLFSDPDDADPVNNTWATCTADVDGDCSFTVPIPNGQAPQYWVKQISAPAGYFMNPQLRTGGSGTGSTTDYVFETPDLEANTTYTSTSTSDGFMYATGNSNADASSGTWQQSVNNPPAEQQCGLNAALLLDVSGSVAPDLSDLKGAANSMVDALVGTPSQLALYTFNDESPSSAGGGVNQPLRNVSTAGDAQDVKDDIDGLSANDGTNWDQGLWALSQIADTLDVVIVVTDGNPTFYGPNAEGPGNYTRFREMENAIFSANAIKAKDARIITLGVGDGLGAAAALNLRAVSGEGAFYQSESYDAAAEIVRNLALGACQNRLSVIKQTVDANGENEQVAGGWDITASGTIVDGSPQTKTTAPETGGVNFDLTIPGGGSGTVSVSEDLTSNPNFEFLDVQCTDTSSGDLLTVSNINPLTGSFDVQIPSTQTTASCTITNQSADPASVIFEKSWVIDGTTYAHGSRPSGYDATGSIDGDSVGIGSERGGFEAGDTVAVGESTTAAPDQPLCEEVVEELVSINGDELDTPVTLTGDTTYDLTLLSGENVVGLRNTQECESRVTLEKSVQGGDADPADWTLTANTPDGAIEGPSGVTGVTGEVSPSTRYILTESGDPRYVQTIAPNAEPTPPATGSWQCIKLDANGEPIPNSQYDGLNGGVTVPRGQWAECTATNVTAELTLLKNVDNNAGGGAVEGDFDLTATPTGDVPAGLSPETVPGADATSADNTFLVRPGTPYALTESDVDGYELDTLVCVDEDDSPVDLGDSDTVTVPQGEHYTCTYTNSDIAPTLTLVKAIGGNGDQELVDAWTLTASDADVEVLTGTSGVNGDVEAGVEYTLDEALIDPDGPGRAYYQDGTWSCSNEDGAEGTVTLALGANVTCTVTNVPVEPVTIVKDAGDAVQDATDANLWSVDYTLTATNANPVGVEYTITDSIDVPTGASIEQIDVTSSPLGVSINPGFNGQADTLIAEDVAIGAGDPTPSTHVYTVTVVYRTTAAAGEPTGQCDPGDGHVIGNDATVTTYDLPPETDDACVTIPDSPAVTVTKTETSTSQNADGTWTITYDVVATNTSDELAASYDAVDTPTFGDGISISSATWTGATSGSFAGDPLTAQLATDRSLAAGAFETYTVTIVAAVDGATTPEARDCELVDGEDGTGFLNSVTVTVDGQDPTTDSDCSSPVLPTIVKTVATPAAPDMSASDPWAGQWTIAYQVTVSNPSDDAGLVYSLTDVPTPSVGSAESAEVTGAATVSWEAADGEFIIVPADSPVALAAGESDTYTITMSLQIPLDTDLPEMCGDDGTGLVNTATATSGSFTVSDDACGEVPDLPSITLVKEVENGNATEGVADDQDWQLAANGDDSTPFDTAGTSEHFSTILPGTYELSETLLDDSFAGLYTASDWECTVDNEPFAGFSSPDAVTVAYGDDVVCTITNTLVDPIQIAKETQSVTASATEPGQWSIVYTLTVTNPNDVEATYDISDTTELVTGATLDAISVESDDVDVSGTGFGPANSTIAEDVTIGAGPGETQVYTVTATVTVPATVTEPVCGQDGTVQNTGTVTMEPFGDIDSTVCDTTGDLPGVTITKDVSTDPAPVQNNDGSWTIVYDVVVTNTEADQATQYSLTDDLAFGDGITIGDAAWQLQDSGDPGIGGVFAAGFADFTEGGPRALPGGAVHTYTVTAAATVTDESTAETRDCQRIEGEGTGFWNSATVTVGNDSTTVHTCAAPVLPTIDKQFSSTAQHLVDGAWDGSWDLTYEVAVSNPSATSGIVYTLVDEPALPAGVVLNDASISGVAQDTSSIPVSATWNGDTDTDVLDAPRGLAGGEVDVYTVVVNVTASDEADVPTGQCAVGEGAIDNTATVTSGEFTAAASACGPLGEVSVPVVLKTATSVAQGDDGLWTVAYDVVVRNDGEASTQYDLTDLPELPDTMTVSSASWSGESSGDFTVTDGVAAEATLADGKILAGGGATHTYTVELIVDFTESSADESMVCTGEPGAGFYNGVTVTTGDLSNFDSACAEPTVPTVDKSVTSDPEPFVPDGEQWAGQWSVTYDVVVSAPAAVGDPTASYSLTDEPDLSDGVTLISGTASGDQLAEDVTWSTDGSVDIVPTDAPVEIAAGTSHTYTVTLIVLVPLETELPLECGEVPSGIVNWATVTSGNTSWTSNDCGEVPELPTLTLLKTVENGDVTEGVAVPDDWNLSASSEDFSFDGTDGVSSYVLPGTYDLSESITNPAFADYYFQNGDWACFAELEELPELAAQAIEEPGEPSVGADGEFVIPDNSTASYVCRVTNRLVDPVEVEKTSGEPVWDETTTGRWSLEYKVTVTNPNDVPTVYDLTDEIAVADGVELLGVELGDAPEGVTPNADFDGTAENPTVATGVEIGVGDPDGVHVYTMTATFQRGDETGTLETCEVGNVANTATVTTGPLPEGESTVCDELPEPRIVPNAEVVCSQDIPYLTYDIETFNVANIEEETITITWRDAEGNVIDIEGRDNPMEISGAELQGQILWPAGQVNSSGVSIGWPGWRQIVESDLDENGDIADPTAIFWEDVIFDPSLVSADWRPSEGEDLPLTVEFSVNPSEIVEVFYPPADPECEVQRDPDVAIVKSTDAEIVEGGDEFSYDLQVTNAGLGAVWNATLTDEIPQDLMVTDWTTDEEAFPRWTDCEVTGADSNGYGGIFTCDLFGPLPASDDGELVEAPVVTLDVQVMENITSELIVNTGTVCWPGDESDETDAGGCAESTVETPVRAIVPNAEMICLNDIPYVDYSIELINVTDAEGPVTATWRDEDGAVVRVDEIPLDAPTGRLLWPGGEVNEDGISIGWPGWREAREGEVPQWENMIFDPDLESSVWRDTLTVTFQINPESSITVSYPPATPECEVVRDPDLSIQKSANVTEVEAGDSFEYTLEVVNNDLGAADDVTLTDEIPSHLTVDAIVTDGEAFPRWTDCEVTGTDADGYGGTLECHLNGLLGRAATAPPVVLEVTTSGDAEIGDAIHNTGQVCWIDADKPDDGEACTTDDVTVVVGGTTKPAPPTPPLTPTLPKTGADTAAVLAAMAVLLLMGTALVGATRRGRRSGDA